MIDPFNAYLTLGFSLFILYSVGIWLITKRVKDFHYDTWNNKLGKFSLFLNNSAKTSFLSLRYFIFTSRYKGLNDETLNMVIAVRILFVVFMLNFAWGISMMFWPRH